jgi:hypothetical protein
MAKYTYQYYKTSEDNFSDFKINAVVNETNNYITKWTQHVRRMYRDRLLHLIMKYQSRGKRSQGRPQSYFST